MKNYQFRTNWRGLLILQRQVSYHTGYGCREYMWRDATTEDLKDYYAELCTLQTTPTCQELRRRFDAECG
jgi:hypothetical protein